MYVVATAGHVDHGKSTLVRALTGQDPDRLEEEHRRGLSIQLGYCWTTLEAVGEVAFVDVPGHERFLSTTLAGLGPVPVALLVVAADDPWMPQAAEHLAALDALDVRHGLLVVTRSDLADPEPALARARAEADRTSLSGARSVVVSGRTGAGMSELRSALVDLLSVVPAPDAAADVRLWTDRAFHVTGAGTVVTGTLSAGTIRVGDQLGLGDERVRVRGLESLGRPRDQVSGVARVAVQIAGRLPEGTGRGGVLTTPDAFEDVGVVDVRLHGEGAPPERPLLHVGASRVTVHARPLDGPYVRLRLDDPLPLRHGDRAILRDPGNRMLWGVEVLDAAPPGLGRRGAARARAMDLAARGTDLAAEVSARGVVQRSLLRRLGVAEAPLPEGSLAHGDWLASASQAETWRARLAAILTTRPDGVSATEATRLLDLPHPDFLADLVAPPLIQRAGRVLAGSAVPAELAAPLAALRADLALAPYDAPGADRLHELGLDRPALARLARAGELLVLDGGVALLPGADHEAARLLAGLPQPFTTSQARQVLSTSRRVVLPLLAHLDRAGRTVRLPDDRRRLRGD